jgi:UDP-N-acetylglucosamine--N-acetylmuramyl-(pentapeptide) pyrophosphoryl-undecaprenol N-acetylglucosamine transferase
MRVLVVSGASGGHIFPALGFLDSLKEKAKFMESLLVLPRNCLENGIEISGYKVKYISITSIGLRIDLKNIFSIFRFFKATFESLFILFKFNPDIVVGFGSLASVPMLLLAWSCRIKTLIHEQNVIPGRANRFLAKFTDRIAVSFEETKKFLKGYENKTVFSGNPIRRDLIRIDKFKALDFFGLKTDKSTLLVMGGSLASHRINIVFLKTLSGLTAKFKLQVVHLCGAKDFDLLNSGYKDLGLNFRLLTFLKEMQYAYSASDLVVCRAGATTISELIFFKLPAVIVPYPYAGGHQIANAKILERKGCAVIIEDDELEPERLQEVLEGLIHTPQNLQSMRSGYGSLRSDNANELLVNAVLTSVKS